MKGLRRDRWKRLEGPRQVCITKKLPVALEPVPPIIAAPRRPRDSPSSSYATRTSSDRPDAPAAALHTVHQLRPLRTRARALHLPLLLVSVSSLFFSVSWLAGNIFLSSARCRPRSLSHRQFSSSNLDPLFSPVPGERVPSSLLFFCRF